MLIPRSLLILGVRLIVVVRARWGVVPGALAPVPELSLGLLGELELSVPATDESAALANFDTRSVLTLLPAVPPTEALMENGVTKGRLTGVSIAKMSPEERS